jgi:type II secretory pathway pseudopilin PulG
MIKTSFSPPPINPTRCVNGMVTNGFSLIELLAVMGVMIILMGLVVPAVSSIGKASSLNAGGALVTGLINAARQNSLTNNAMTALVIVTDPSLDAQYRMFTMLEALPRADGQALTSSDWQQISKWETLSPGIVVDNNAPLQSGSSGSISPPFPAQLSYGNHPISPNQLEFLVFYPDGSISSPNPATIKLVEGYYSKGSSLPLYTGGPANCYQMTVLNATGRIKIVRP